MHANLGLWYGNFRTVTGTLLILTGYTHTHTNTHTQTQIHTNIKTSIHTSEINPTRCNNCVYSSQWLYSTCLHLVGFISLLSMMQGTTNIKHTYIYTYVRTYIHTYIHTDIHKYIHTHIHTYTYICELFCGEGGRERNLIGWLPGAITQND